MLQTGWTWLANDDGRPSAQRLRFARCCYDHLAGRLAQRRNLPITDWITVDTTTCGYRVIEFEGAEIRSHVVLMTT